MRKAKALALAPSVLAAVLTFGVPGSVSGASITLAAVDADRGSGPFPGPIMGLFNNDNSIAILAPPSDVNPMLLPSHERGGVEFAFAGIPAGASITSATLFLTLLPSGISAGDAAEYTATVAMESSSLRTSTSTNWSAAFQDHCRAI